MEAINKSVQDKEKQNSKTSCSELEVHNPRFYFISFVMDWYELGKRIGFYNETVPTSEMMELRRQVIIALLKNGLLANAPHLDDVVRGDGYISADLDFDLDNLNTEDDSSFIFSKKGTSADAPIELSCDKDLVSRVEESVVLYLNSSSLYLERYESREIVGREDRKINGKTLDVIKVHVKYYDIFGKTTSQHLVEWFFKNTLC
jgi:hypothetical protein